MSTRYFLTISSSSSSIFSCSCLFVSWCFYLRHQKTPPAPPSFQHPPSPWAVKMICKLQTSKSPSLVSSAHLGNSIRPGGGHAASPSCPQCPCSSGWSSSGRSATNSPHWASVMKRSTFKSKKKVFTLLTFPIRDLSWSISDVVKLLWPFYTV